MAFDIFDLAAKISLDSTALEEGLQKTQGSLSAGAVAMGNLASNAISTAPRPWILQNHLSKPVRILILQWHRLRPRPA